MIADCIANWYCAAGLGGAIGSAVWEGITYSVQNFSAIASTWLAGASCLLVYGGAGC